MNTGILVELLDHTTEVVDQAPVPASEPERLIVCGRISMLRFSLDQLEQRIRAGVNGTPQPTQPAPPPPPPPPPPPGRP